MAFQNINGFPTSSRHPKNNQIQLAWEELDIDILGVSETNMFWPNLPFADRLQERLFGWFERLHINFAFTSKERAKERYQSGGTALFARNELASRALFSGRDPRGLGRWVWTRFQGKHNITLRVCFAYRPCRSAGPTSAYQQHRRALLEEDIDICPRTSFFVDLKQEVETWIQDGDQVVLMLDVNADIRSVSEIAEMGLVDALTHRHGPGCPATFQEGTSPIDGVFVTPGLLHQRCGVLAFGYLAIIGQCGWICLTTWFLVHKIYRLISLLHDASNSMTHE